jgi:hypothetical protein
MTEVTEPPSPESPANQPLAEQLARTEADVHALAEQLGAVRPGEASVYSMRRAMTTFAVVAGLAALVGWFLWSHWHSLLVALAPLIWIFGSAWRHHRRQR